MNNLLIYGIDSDTHTLSV